MLPENASHARGATPTTILLTGKHHAVCNGAMERREHPHGRPRRLDLDVLGSDRRASTAHGLERPGTARLFWVRGVYPRRVRLIPLLLVGLVCVERELPPTAS
jgi:hypothetical protein